VEIRTRDRVPAFVTADGSTIRELVGLRATPGVSAHSLAEASLAPGQATERHYHGLTEETYYLVQGRGLMELDGETAKVAAGDAILIPPGSRHQIRNTGEGPLRLLCACAPPYRDEDTFFE
jgi:mannose-6-phosphate isomerase-like protein (cupin superfamily)